MCLVYRGQQSTELYNESKRAVKVDMTYDFKSKYDKHMYSERMQNNVDIERHRKLEFRAGLLKHSGIILDQHILWFGPSIDLDFPSYGFQLLQLKSVLLL